MKKSLSNNVGIITLVVSCACNAASLEKATMYNEHGLIIDAKKELIAVINEDSPESEKADAYYLLGSIAFDENRISVALDSWRTLVEKYPEASKSKFVKDRITELAEIVGETTEESIKNAVAQSYLRHADFWSKDKDRVFTIDSSWLPIIEISIKWYDKVLNEFPKSAAAETAYRGKLRTLLGWSESGRYGESYGVKKEFAKYMPQLLTTFFEYEKDFPVAGSLQAFRYQIAQAYWSNKDWDNTRKWLNVVVEKAGKKDSFYKDLAERRLQKVEY